MLTGCGGGQQQHALSAKEGKNVGEKVKTVANGNSMCSDGCVRHDSQAFS